MINSDIKLLTIVKQDYNDVIKFLSNFENEKKDKDFWEKRLEFWWDKNPAFSNDSKRGWIIKDNKKGRIVGFIANIPTFFLHKGKKIITINGSTWRVNSRYSNQSILLLLKQIKYSKETILFDTSPTKKVEQMIKKLGFQKFQTAYNTKYCFYLDPKELVKDKLSNISFIGYIISKLLKLYHSLFFIGYKKLHKTRIIKDKYCSDFDHLWHKTKDTYINTGVRDSNFMEWYCFNKSGKNKIVFGYYNNDMLEAYSIFNPTGVNNSILYCLDLWGLKMDKAVFKSLCKAVIDYGKENGFKIIIFPYFNNNLKNIYFKSGLIRRSQNDRRYYRIPKNSSIYLNNDKTYLTYLNGDMGLL